MCDNRVSEWVKLALKNEGFNDYTVKIDGKSGNGDGYIGNVTFVNVSGKTKSGSPKILDFVIKSSKESANLRKQVPTQQVFDTEIYIYDKVKNAFDKFQREKGVETLIEVIPRCYATQSTGVNEMLVFENLKSKGYDVWDRKKPMPFDHIKIILEAYGKWHALSLALKRQRPETFYDLTKNSVNMFSVWMLKVQIIDVIREIFNESKRKLDFNQECEALKKVDFSRDDFKYILIDLFFEEPEYHVILHGDCWTNNFMFKFRNNSTIPEDVRIIDWQLSAMGSPILDLSYFLYCCCSEEDYQDLEGLLKIYHDSLSAQLEKLGSDPEEVYPFNTLMRHWRKFSKYGMVMSAFLLKFSLCEADEAPDFAQGAEAGKKFSENLFFTIKNEDLYLDRVKHNILHYAKYA